MLPTEETLIDTLIRDVPDFPKPGIVFKDITPLLASPEGLKQTIDGLAQAVDPSTYDVICGIESRGFIFGTALALQLGKGFVPMRKPGKLPYTKVSQEYQLEYGTDCVELHTDAFDGTPRVLLLDDLLATGGTMGAGIELVRRVGGEVVACSFVIELGFLNGRDPLREKGIDDAQIHALLSY
ncbi:MAG: adenine phosphoribosyltransferase [Planctomycetota bacterium]